MGFAASHCWAESATSITTEEFVGLLREAARAQHQTHYADLSTHDCAPGDPAWRALDGVEAALEAAMRDVFPAQEWIVLRSTGPHSCIFRQRTGRGLHVDASSVRDFLPLCCAAEVVDALRPLDATALADAVQPVNLWVLLEGERGLLAAPALLASAPQSQVDEAEEHIFSALRAGQRPLPHGALTFAPTGALGAPASEARHGQHDALGGAPVLLFDATRLFHCGLAHRELSALLLHTEPEAARDARAALDGLHGARHGMSVDFRKIAIRRRATSCCGGPIDVRPLRSHVLYGL